MKKRLTTLLLVSFTALYGPLLAQNTESGPLAKKSYQIVKTTTPPVIDGVFDDEVWQNANTASQFVMFQPGNGEPIPEGFETEVKLAYDDDAIYVAVNLKDPSPDSILKQVTQRDNFSENNDWFGIFINPFYDGLNDFNFYITSAGVQADSKNTANGEDMDWNTVWDSKVVIDEEGWKIELEIPYRCLRLPEQDGDWGLNMIRSIRRSRHDYSWSFLDRRLGNFEVQTGKMSGIKDVKSPVRLSFMPYAQTSLDVYEGDNSFGYSLGADAKYGINKSYTLDITLIPDFGQVPFDRQFVNLSPFENQFDENRQFFVEGVELFNRSNLFYSRRIGGSPKNISGVNLNDSNLTGGTQEYTQLLNATKVTGRGSTGWGLGFLNAITDNNYFTATDTLGNEVKQLVEPLTNYNALVVDKRFNQNSSVGIMNTNVLRDGAARDANVTSAYADIMFADNSYRANANVNTSVISENGSSEVGFNTLWSLEKQRGKFRYSFGQEIIDTAYDPNDMGFLRRGNFIYHYGQISYEIFEPWWKLNRYRVNLSAEHQMLYSTGAFESFSLQPSAFFVTTDFFAGGWNANYSPVEEYDYFEPRTPGRFVKYPSNYGQEFWISTDYRHPFALDARIFHFSWIGGPYNGWNLNVSPRFRFSDQVFAVYEFNTGREYNNLGYAGSSGDTVYMGFRNIHSVTNSLATSYNINPDLSITLDFRHYYTTLQYTSYQNLNQDGTVSEIDKDLQRDLTFNSVNLDLKLNWWFVPGSTISVLYRNSLLNTSPNVDDSYFESVEDLAALPFLHQLSFRLTYFLDYNDVVKWSRKK
ncbi:MAG: hypothetical protein SchgKO_17020 [Schleiferiaceae bacterium]